MKVRHDDRDKADDLDVSESTAIFQVLCRYSSAQGGHYRAGAMQAAVPEEVLDVLGRRLGVTMECFASPFNCYWSRFGSAFPDTDAPFGS